MILIVKNVHTKKNARQEHQTQEGAEMNSYQKLELVKKHIKSYKNNLSNYQSDAVNKTKVILELKHCIDIIEGDTVCK